MQHEESADDELGGRDVFAGEQAREAAAGLEVVPDNGFAIEGSHRRPYRSSASLASVFPESEFRLPEPDLPGVSCWYFSTLGS